MKRYEDKGIKLYLRQLSQTKTVEVDCSIHTNIHAIKILICKQLHLPPLETNVEIFFNRSQPLKATSTLLQNNIPNGSTLTINVKSLGLSKSLKNGNSDIKREVLQSGLSVKYICKNLKCINNSKDSVVNLGFGQFDIKQMIERIRCQLCPYKSQKIHVPVGCREVIVKQCLFSILTIQHDEGSIFKEVYGDWTKCKDQKIITRKLKLDDKQIGKILKIKMI